MSDSPVMRDTAEAVLGLLPPDVQYGDIRVVRRTHEQVLVELDGPGEVGYDDSTGLGLRVLIGGQWGFAATHRLDRRGLDAVVAQAVGQARAAGGGGRVSLGSPVTTRDRWSSPMQVDPFTVPLSSKLDLLAA
ncbi:PmbA/TldA family metallopeptidase, partial [Kribbella sp. NPDC002412]